MSFGPQWNFFSNLCLLVHIDADVEPTVIPVGLVIAAPFAVVVHNLYVISHLPAIFAVLGSILVDPGAICFELLTATFAPVAIRPSGSPHSQEQTPGQRGGQSHSSP
jgi:hypothetical protein